MQSLIFVLFCVRKNGWGWDNFIKEAGDTWKMGEIKTGYPGARIATTEVGTDAEIENSELYRVAKMFLAAVRNGESYEN